MNEPLEDSVSTAMQHLARNAPRRQLDATNIRRAVRISRVRIVSPVAAVLAVGAILAGVAVGHPEKANPTPPAADSSACAPLTTGAPPTWARGGFFGNSYPPFATSRSGDIVAIVFGNPLASPPSPHYNNKILWVARDGAYGDMTVTAHLEGSETTTTTQIPIGPSIVNMPAAGCWELDLAMPGRDSHDTIYLRWTNP